MQNTSLLRNGVEPLAIALILAPEPTTTVIGLGLLAYSRMQRYLQGKQQVGLNRHTYRPLRYSCKMKLVQGETIVYRTYPVQRGQLPPATPPEKGMFYNPELWRAYFQDNRKRVVREKESLAVKPAAVNALAFKRPASMPTNVRSYHLPHVYRPQPKLAAAWA